MAFPDVVVDVETAMSMRCDRFLSDLGGEEAS